MPEPPPGYSARQRSGSRRLIIVGPRFRAQTAGRPQTTEVERLIDVLADALDARPITGITDPALLRAFHIVPWAECDDAQRAGIGAEPVVPRTCQD